MLQNKFANIKSVFIFAAYNKEGRYSSGQRGQTVNLLTTSSQVRILLSPQNKNSNILLEFFFILIFMFLIKL